MSKTVIYIGIFLVEVMREHKPEYHAFMAKSRFKYVNWAEMC